MTDIEQALSEIKRRAVTTDLKLYQEGVGVRAGFHKTRHVPCICITEDVLTEVLIEMARARDKVLQESGALQSHYAALLNDYDGGKRRAFATAEEWVARLRETGALATLDTPPAQEQKR